MNRFIELLCVLLLWNYCKAQMVNLQSLEYLIRRTDNENTQETKQDVSATEIYGKLKDDIMDRLVVRKKIPPSVSESEAVFLYLEPLQLISVDEVQQSIHLSHITDVRWLDPNMKWDPASYNNISQLEVDTSAVWTPSLVLPKNVVDGIITLPQHVTLTSDGYFISSFSGNINSLCHFDLTYFPFDQHRCTIVFLGESSFRLLPDSSSRHVDVTSYFQDGAEWLLLQNGCASKQDSFMYVECFVSIQRRSTFYVANLIIPMMFTSAMTLMVFWIPAETGEKMSFLVSVFVSTFVFLNYIVETVPRSMGNLPRINALLIFVVIKVILSAAATNVVLHRCNNSRTRSPQSTVITRTKQGHHHRRRNIEEAVLAHVNFSSSLESIYSTSECLEESLKKNKDLFLLDAEKHVACFHGWEMWPVVVWWRSMSHADLDKCFFVLLLCVTLVAYCAMLFV